MANYAYVSNGNIEGLYDSLPVNWKNISNFYLLTDTEIVNYGWKKIIKPPVEFDATTHRLGNIDYYLLGDKVYERVDIVEIPTAPLPSEQDIILQQQLQWDEVRSMRDTKMQEFEWRYSRYERQVRLGVVPTDDLTAMDSYMQSLADITTQQDPFNIIWPEYIV